MAAMKRKPAPPAEQLSVFAELAALPEPIHEPAPDTMRQIVSLRMPDALLERVEEVARGRCPRGWDASGCASRVR